MSEEQEKEQEQEQEEEQEQHLLRTMEEGKQELVPLAVCAPRAAAEGNRWWQPG